MPEEREIDLRELLYAVLKNWRKVIAYGLLIGALAGVFKLAVGLYTTLNPEKLELAQENYEIAHNNYDASIKLLTEDIADLREESKHQTEYNENSMIMRIDAMQKCVGSFDVYIDSKYQIDPSLTYQNIDLTTRLLSAYYSYMTGGEMYGYLLENTDMVSELRYLTEILSIYYNTGSSSITVTCTADTEEHVREMLDLVKSCIAEKYSDIKAAIGDHDYSVMMESSYSTVDLDLEKAQKYNKQVVSENDTLIAEKKEELEELKREGEPEPEFGYHQSAVGAVKFLIIGCIAGALLLAVYYAIAFAVTRKVTGDTAWQALGLVVLGTVYKEKKSKSSKIDLWIDRMMGYERPKVSLGESCALAAANITALLKKQEANSAVIVSIAEEDLTKKIMESMPTAQEQSFTCIGNLLKDHTAVEKLNSKDRIVLLAEEGKNTIEEVERIKTLSAAWGNELLGVLAIK